MIQHIVLLRFKPGTTEDQIREALVRIGRFVERLRG